jgi:hypothetical protein
MPAVRRLGARVRWGDDLTAALLAAIAERRLALRALAGRDPVFDRHFANLDAWEAVARLHVIDRNSRLAVAVPNQFCWACRLLWPCPTIVIPGRLFIPRELWPEYGIREPGDNGPFDRISWEWGYHGG